jgi:flagellar motor switch protein FliG
MASHHSAVNGELSAAIMMMLLDDCDASAVLQHLTPAEIKSLGKGMFEASNASENDIERALDSFVIGNGDLSTLAVGAPHRIRGMMQQALGDVRAGTILSEIEPETPAPSLDILRWMDAETISALVAGEQPQISAVIVSVLPPEVAALAIAALDEAVQADIVYRAATLQPVSSEAIEDLEAVLSSCSQQRSMAPELRFGGRNEVAQIVNNLSRASGDKLLRSLRKKDRLLANAIEDEMFVFDDLAQLDVKALGAVLRNVESDQIALAIKGASVLLTEKMLGTLSARAAETIRDELADMGQVKRSDVEDAQKIVIAAARSLADSGEIVLGGMDGDYV